MQQVPQESIFDVCLPAFELPDNFSNRQKIKLLMTAIPEFKAPIEFNETLENISKLRQPSSEVLSALEFQIWLFDNSENPEKIFLALKHYNIKFHPEALIKAIKYHLDLDFFQFLVSNSNPIPFSCLLECLALLELQKKEKKTKVWAQKTQKFLFENIEHFVIADTLNVNRRYCFHNNGKFLSVLKEHQLEINFNLSKPTHLQTNVFFCDDEFKLFANQSILTPLQLAIYFALPCPILLRFFPKEELIRNLQENGIEIFELLKKNPEYFEHLDSTLDIMAPISLRNYLLFQAAQEINDDFLVKNFNQSSVFYRKCIKKNNKKTSGEYQRIWQQIEKSPTVIPELKDELQSIINFPQQDCIEFEEWLFYNTKITNSLLIIKKWGINFLHLNSTPNNLFMLGIYHQQPIIYFRFLVEKLNYKIFVGDYFNCLACLNAQIAQGNQCEWLAQIWEFMVEKGDTFILHSGKQHYSYHFNEEENALMILSESTNHPYLQVVYLDEKKVFKHQELFVTDYQQLKSLGFKYFFESEFIIEQVNSQIILHAIFLYLEQDKQLSFMQALLALIQNECVLKEYSEYRDLLRQPVVIAFNQQQVTKSLEEYLQHHIKRLLFLDKKWQKLIDTASENFGAKLKIVGEKKFENYQLVLNQLLAAENPAVKPIISQQVKEWLFESTNPFENILTLLDKNYQLDDYLNHDISILGLAVLKQYPIGFIQTLVEKYQLKCTVIDFLQILAFLEIHTKDLVTLQWAQELKSYFLGNRFKIIIIEDFPCHRQYYFYDSNASLVSHDLTQDSYCLMQKNDQEAALKRTFFKLHYESDKKIQFDSILQFAIKLQVPVDVLDILITHKNVKESLSNPDKHLYYELLKLEHSLPEYFAEVLTLVTNKFCVFDPNENNLLHLFVMHDRADLIAKHYSLLLPYVEKVNAFGHTPVTQDLNCSKETFELLMKMQPCISDPNIFYRLFINPKYTAILMNVYPAIYFNQKLKSGMNLIQELFNKHDDLVTVLQIILATSPNFLNGMNKDDLLSLSIHQEMTLEKFKAIHEMLGFKKEAFDILHFAKACEFTNWDLANYLFKVELFEKHFAYIIQTQAILEFCHQQNIILQYPVLADLISSQITSLSVPYQKSFLKQILTLAKSSKHWLCEFNHFPDLLRLALKLDILKPNEQCKSGENLLYFIELYCYTNKDYALLTQLCDKQYKIDFNRKNLTQEHIIISIIKQENGIERLMAFLTHCRDQNIEINKLNAKGDNLLGIMIESHCSSFVKFCFTHLESSLLTFIDEDLKKKPSKLIELFRKDKEFFSFFSTKFNPEQWQKIQQLSICKEFLDLKNCLPVDQKSLLVAEKKPDEYDWQEFKSFLLNANAIQILNLPSFFKTVSLPKLITENRLFELYLILKSRPPLCMKEFSKIKSIAVQLQQVADDCYFNEDMDLLKQLQLSLPKDIHLKNRMITDWASLKKLLSEDIALAFKLLGNAKLEELLSRNCVIELYTLIITTNAQYLTKFHEYPAIQKRIPYILHVAHENNMHFITKEIYSFLPKEFQAYKRLHILAKTTVLDETPKFAKNSNSLLALNLFTSKDQKIAEELDRRKKLPPNVWIDESMLPAALKQLYQILTPFLHSSHQYLGVYGSSVRHIFNQKHHDSDYDCFAVLTCDLESIFNLLKKMNFGHVNFIRCSKPIIRITILQEKQNPTQIDLSHFDLDTSLEPNVAIEQELEKHDFTISGAYTKITENTKFQIFGSDKTLMALHEKKLALMSPTRLEEDPLRLMRAIKIHIDDENYQDDEELHSIIESRQPQQALSHFLLNQLHCRQFATQLDKVLKNPKQQLMVFELMEQYHIFETWTGFKYHEVKSQLQSLPEIDSRLIKACQLKFIKYFYILTVLKLSSFAELEKTVIYKVTRGFSPTDRMFFDFIDGQLLGLKQCDIYVESKDTLLLIEEAKKVLGKPS